MGIRTNLPRFLYVYSFHQRTSGYRYLFLFLPPFLPSFSPSSLPLPSLPPFPSPPILFYSLLSLHPFSIGSLPSLFPFVSSSRPLTGHFSLFGPTSSAAWLSSFYSLLSSPSFF